MLRKSLLILVFILFIALLLELTLRMMVFGTDALSFEKMRGYGAIIDTEFVQRAENTDVYFELKPNLDTWFAGKKFVTNSQGLADKEYSVSKPENTFRVAVVGSSWSMATSVELKDNYHTLLEERLGKQLAPKKVEFINFSVETYGLGEIIATVRHKVLAYEPDMIIMPVTALTPVFLWEDDKEPFERSETVPVIQQSYLYSSIMSSLGKKAYHRTFRPRVNENRGGYMRQIRRAFSEVDAIATEEDIDILVLKLTHKGFNESTIQSVAKVADQHGFNFIHAHVDDIADEKGVSDEPLFGKPYISHPNELGHWLIAERVFDEMWGSGAPLN